MSYVPLMSYVSVFIEIILLFAAAFVTHFYLQRWKQVITNDIISGIGNQPKDFQSRDLSIEGLKDSLCLCVCVCVCLSVTKDLKS